VSVCVSRCGRVYVYRRGNHLSDLSMFANSKAKFAIIFDWPSNEQLSPAGLSRTSFAGCDHTLVPTKICVWKWGYARNDDLVGNWFTNGMGFPLNVQLHNSYNESHDFLPSYLLQVDGTRHNIPVELQIQAFIKAIICGQPNSYSNLNPMPYKPTSFRDGCVFPDVFGQHGRNFPARGTNHRTTAAMETTPKSRSTQWQLAPLAEFQDLAADGVV